MMFRLIGAALSVACAAAISTAALAAPVAYNAQGRPSSQHSSPGGGFSTKAKVAYYYSRGQTDRSKNVADFENPSTGIYCIEPSIPVNLKKDEPLVSVEWARSFGYALEAYWIDVNDYSDCPDGYLEVTTYDFNAGGYPVLSDEVAFNLVIE